MNLENKKILDGFHFKVIGIILMIFDHIYQMFYYLGVPNFFKMLGRPVAVMFLFMSVEGYHYTRNKFKYMRNLLIGFWGMRIASTAIQKIFVIPEEYSVQLMNSIFGTLFLSVLYMHATFLIVEAIKNKKYINILYGVLIIFVPFIIAIMLFTLPLPPALFTFIYTFVPTPLTVEAGPLLPIIGIFLYLLREKRALQVVAIMLFSLITTNFNFTGLFTSNINWMMVFSIIPIMLYNGQKGKNMKWFFYFFYPLHIYALYILAYLYTRFAI